MDSFYFYDLETTGRNPRWHRIVQCAGVRTDANLEPLSDPEAWTVAVGDDVVPEPEAVAITGLSPQRVAGGLEERAFFREFLGRLGTPRTCALGYNSLRFDDEFIRFGAWRNLFDPYAREWQGGNSRWDLMDLVRLAYALRPEGLQWPEKNGRAVFRLEALASANGISQPRAHDARDDVWATLGLARALKAAQPKLFAYYLGLRDKQKVRDLLPKPFAGACLYVSGRFDLARRRLAVITPVAPHPTNGNGVIVADLSFEDDRWLTASPEALREALFTQGFDGPRPPLKVVSVNKVPALAPLSVLRSEDRQRLGVDLDRLEAVRERLSRVDGLSQRVAEAFGGAAFAPAEEIDAALYEGFIPRDDRATLTALRDGPVADLAAPPPLREGKSRALLEAYQARWAPETLGSAQRSAWEDRLRDRLRKGRDGATPLAEAEARLAALLPEASDPAPLQELAEHYAHLRRRWGL